MKTHILILISLFHFLLPLNTSFARDVSFKWNANTDKIDGYKLYYKTGSSGVPYKGKGIKEGKSPIKIGKKLTNKTLHNLSDTETYYFVLTAYKGKKESSYTAEIVLKGNSTPSNKDTNSPPTAIISASGSIGAAPFKVKFDGSLSSDSDGSIKSYKWDMGDGKQKSGKKISYKYKKPGTYYVTLTVKDNDKATDSQKTPIIVTSSQGVTGNSQSDISFDPGNSKSQPVFTMEVGKTMLSHSWKKINLQEDFIDPVVVATTPSTNSYDPATVRIRNVTPSGFEIRIKEWNYQNGSHTEESVSYIVLEKGHYKMEDGTLIEADTFEATHKSSKIKFIKKFKKKPVLFTSVTSYKEKDTVTSQIQKISKNNFKYRLREQEKNKQNHSQEQIAYIAWEPGSGKIGGVKYEVARTKKVVTEKWHQIEFESQSSSAPYFLATMQSLKENDTASLRYKSLSGQGVKVRIEEEQSKDDEINHKKETVGYMIFK